MLRKLALSIFSLFAIATITFFLMKLVPGDPLEQETKLPAEVYVSLQKYYHLDRPWYEQYWRYIASIVTWDFGPSMSDKDRSVNQIIHDSFFVSAQLGIFALLITLSFGVLFGILMAYTKGTTAKFMQILLVTLGTSIPAFILAVLLQYLFAYKLRLLPVARWGSFSHMVLPAISLSVLPSLFIARFMQNSFQKVFKQDYIAAARANGLPEREILFRHALKNAILPLIAYLGQLIANILTGTVIIEKIFAIPGLGQWFVLSISNRDYPAIMGITVFYSMVLILSLFCCEMVRMALDPRTRRNYNYNPSLANR